MATLSRLRPDLSEGSLSASDVASFGVQTAQVEIDLIHEIGSDLVGGTIRRELIVDPSHKPTLVSVTSQVVTEAAWRLNSPQYIATVRRRKATKIKNAIASLAKKAGRNDFEVFALKVVEEVRELLVQLTDVQREGNTREILRQIRDTFLDGGYERYREATARDLVATILERLAEADEVTPDDVDQVWDELYDSGLAALIPAVFAVSEGKEEANG